MPFAGSSISFKDLKICISKCEWTGLMGSQDKVLGPTKIIFLISPKIKLSNSNTFPQIYIGENEYTEPCFLMFPCHIRKFKQLPAPPYPLLFSHDFCNDYNDLLLFIFFEKFWKSFSLPSFSNGGRRGEIKYPKSQNFWNLWKLIPAKY